MPTTKPNMLLSALAKLESLRDPNHANAKRQYHRFVARGEAVLTPMDPGAFDQEPVNVMLRDVGRGGFGFVAQKALPRNSTWRLNIVNRNCVIAMAPIIVRHSAQVLNEQTYLVGSQTCAESGLLSLVGVEPSMINEGDNPGSMSDKTFLAPGEVA